MENSVRTEMERITVFQSRMKRKQRKDYKCGPRVNDTEDLKKINPEMCKVQKPQKCVCITFPTASPVSTLSLSYIPTLKFHISAFPKTESCVWL